MSNIEYAMRDQENVTVCNRSMLQLTVASTGKIVSFEKERFEAGRGEQCQLRFDGSKLLIARIHAWFIYEENCW